MRGATLWERLDDWVNPIVVKELRQAVKSRMIVTVLLGFVALQTTILFGYLVLREMRGRPDVVDWSAGRGVFFALQAILLGTCMLVIPGYAWGRLVGERSDNNVDLLFISTLRPRSIIAGKLAAAVVLALLIFSAFAPFMTFTYLLRGIDFTTILFLLGVDFLASLGATQLGLFLGALPGTRVMKWFLGLAGLGWLVVVFVLILRGTGALLDFEVLLWGEDPWEFWGPVGGLALVVLAFVGLFFCWSVAVVSPPSANRAVAGRVFLVGQWLVTGVGSALWSYHLRGGGHHGPVWAWMVLGVMLGCLQVLISVNERERWGPRVARMIPRRAWLRPGAFLVYSGSAGGITLGLVLVGLTLAGGRAWRAWFPGMAGAGDGADVARTLLASALYVFCYAMSAVLVRGALLEDKVKQQFTWLVTLLLVGLGTAVPAVIAYVVYYDRVGYVEDSAWWLLSNPFASVYEVATGGRTWHEVDYEAMCFWFVGVWAGVVALLALPWYVGQVRAFRPPARRDSPEAPAEVVEVAEVAPGKASAPAG